VPLELAFRRIWITLSLLIKQEHERAETDQFAIPSAT